MSQPAADAASSPLVFGRGAGRAAVVHPGRTRTAGARLELAVVWFGLFLCTGLLESLTGPGFRFIKHGFYGLIVCLLLLRCRPSARVAARDWLLGALAGLLILSALWSDMPLWALKRGLVMLQTTAFGLYLASRFSQEEQLRALNWVLVLSLLVVIASAWVNPVASFSTPGHEGAFRGPLAHKNMLGRLMALAVPALMLGMLGLPRLRALFGLALGAAAVCVVLSRSFGGMLAAAMLGLVVALHALRPRSLAALLVPVLAIAMVTGAAFGGLLDDVLIAVGKDPTLTGRTQIWDHTMRLLAERPLLGHSIASWWQLDIVERTGVWFSNAHNGYLQTLIDLGLIGLAVMVLQLLSTCLRSLRRARPGRDSRQGSDLWAAAWPWCLAAFVLVYNLFEVCTVEENSLVWVLYVSASLAVRSPEARQPARLRAQPTRMPAPGGVTL